MTEPVNLHHHEQSNQCVANIIAIAFTHLRLRANKPNPHCKYHRPPVRFVDHRPTNHGNYHCPPVRFDGGIEKVNQKNKKKEQPKI